MFEVPRRNKAGVLAIFWKEGFPLDIETFSSNHTDTTINKNKENEWRFTGFYGELETHKRHESWTKLRSLKNCGSSPWLCAGNFNEITRQSEKQGRRSRPHNKMQPFKDVMDECGFMDLKIVGFPFTWHKHYLDFTVCERLDRSLATNEWFLMFPGIKVHHLDVTTSDHKALWISLEGMDCSFQKPFRFEQMWMTDCSF